MISYEEWQMHPEKREFTLVLVYDVKYERLPLNTNRFTTQTYIINKVNTIDNRGCCYVLGTNKSDCRDYCMWLTESKFQEHIIRSQK